VLAKLEKGHTRAGFIEAVALCRAAGLPLAPTFVAFTPWTTLDSHRDLLRTIAGLDLVEHVAPVQWGLRLLVTQGSRLLELEEIRARAGTFDPVTLTYPWRHEDPRVDALQASTMHAVGITSTRSRREIFNEVCDLADVAELTHTLPSRSTIPFLNEPWYC
jgi:hypothetical protein